MAVGWLVSSTADNIYVHRQMDTLTNITQNLHNCTNQLLYELTSWSHVQRHITYNIAKHLASILAPLVDYTQHHIKNSPTMWMK